MYDAIVLAGGAARRLGGVDKPAVDVGGSTLLELAVSAVSGAQRIVVVGPQRPIPQAVHWCREQPAGGGPVAAIVAGLEPVTADTVLVLAADLPRIGGAVALLLNAVTGHDVALLVDPDGQVNQLAAAWRRTALVSAVRRLGDPVGAAVRTLTASVDSVLVPDTDGWGRDCDTWADIAEARAGSGPNRPHDVS